VNDRDAVAMPSTWPPVLPDRCRRDILRADVARVSTPPLAHADAWRAAAAELDAVCPLRESEPAPRPRAHRDTRPGLPRARVRR